MYQRLIFLIALTVISLNVSAVVFEPDTDVDFSIMHLHNPDTWNLSCESFTGSCNVPAGEYQLTLYDNDWNMIESPMIIEVESKPLQSKIEFSILTKSCSDVQNCRYDCPVNEEFRPTELLSGHCSAFDGEKYIPNFFQLRQERLPNSAFCSTSEVAELTIQITCIDQS